MLLRENKKPSSLKITCAILNMADNFQAFGVRSHSFVGTNSENSPQTLFLSKQKHP